MKTRLTTLVLVLLLGSNAFAGESTECSTRALAGRWMFATDVGKQLFFPGGDITAIGTFKVDRAGRLQGVFDATVAGWMFLPGVKFSGAFTMNSDCTGTLTFTTATGSSRTASRAKWKASRCMAWCEPASAARRSRRRSRQSGSGIRRQWQMGDAARPQQGIACEAWRKRARARVAGFG